MDKTKLMKILRIVAAIALVLIVLYELGIFGGHNSDGQQADPGTTVVADGQAGTGQTGSGSTETGQTGSGSTEAGQTGTELTEPGQSGTGSAQSDTGSADAHDPDAATHDGDNGSGADSDSQSSDDIAQISDGADNPEYVSYRFRNDKLLSEHYEKHGREMGFETKGAYEQAASDVINNPKALHKLEAEDGDGVYYVEESNEFVILSKDGYIRTYFLPNAGKAYYDRQ